MTRGGRSPADDADLEIIELEPNAEQSHHETAGAANVGRRRGPVVIAVIVVAALIGSAIVNGSHDHERSTGTTRPGPPHLPYLFPFRVGAQILTAGLNGLLLLDTDTGSVSAPRIAHLPDGPTTIVAHSGNTVAVRVNTSLYWFSLENRTAHFADAVTAFPATAHGRLWLASPRSATLVPGTPNVVATNGQPIGATRAGLLVATKTHVEVQSTGHSSANDPRILIPTPATVIGVHPDRVAWVTRECGVLRCPVHVTEIASPRSSSWLQLVGHPSALAVEATSARFSPDGNHLAIVIPNDFVTATQTLVVADLRTRATTTTETSGRVEEPARPGSADATGSTIDWTGDSRFLLLTPASGTGPIGIAQPGTARIASSRAPIGIIWTAAAVGTSTVGPLDLLRRTTPARIDTGGPTRISSPALHLIAADDEQVDVLGLSDNRIRTWPLGGEIPNPAGANSVARVTGGWLIVRGGVIDLLPDTGPTDSAVLVDTGSLVFSANAGRNAWIAAAEPGLSWRVEPYNPATRKLGRAVVSGVPVGAVDSGLLVLSTIAFGNTEFDIIDSAGQVHRGPAIDSSRINVLAAGGEHVALLGSGGLFLLDLARKVNGLITPRAVQEVSLSRGGTALAWIEDDRGHPGTGRVMAMRVGAAAVTLGTGAEHVLVADDGTVLFTSGVEMRQGRVDKPGSTPVYGLAPDPAALFALG